MKKKSSKSPARYVVGLVVALFIVAGALAFYQTSGPSILANAQKTLAAVGASSTTTATSTNPMPVTKPSLPTVTKKSGDMSLIYGTDKIQYLKAQYVVTVSAGKDNGIYIPQSFSPISVIIADSAGRRIPDSCKGVYYTTKNIKVFYDNKGNSFLFLPAGQSADYTVALSCNVNQMFAGSYISSLSSLTWVNFLSEMPSLHSLNLQSIHASNSQYIVVGEKGPYISGVTFDSNNRTVVIAGERLNQVNFITIGAIQFPASIFSGWVNKTDNKIIVQEAKTWSAGWNQVHVGSVVGESNWSYVTITPTLPVASTLSVTNTSVKATAITNGNKPIVAYSAYYNFTLVNNGNNNLYVSTNPSQAFSIQTSPINSSSTINSFVSGVIAGDTISAYIIPAGGSRSFITTGVIRKVSNVSYTQGLQIDRIYYGTSLANLRAQSVFNGALYSLVNF